MMRKQSQLRKGYAMKTWVFWTLLILGAFLFFSSMLVPVEVVHTEIITKMKFLLLQLAVILVVAKLFGELFSRYLHQPAVLGEIIAGILIGPFALGSIPLPILGKPLFPLPPGAEQGLAFPISPELYGIATIAAVVLLFLAGLETDFYLFLRQSFAGTLVGIGGVLGAFLLGAWTTIAFGYADHFMDPVALFMGSISVATSVGITARVLSEQKSLDSPEGTTILAGAVIDDVLGILILAIIVGMVGVKDHGEGKAEKKAAVVKHEKMPEKAQEQTAKAKKQVPWEKIGKIGYKAFSFWLGAVILGILFASRIQWFLKMWKSQGTMMALGLALAFLFAGLAEMAGLAAIIGAYSIGLALSKEKISKELEIAFEGIYSVFVPVFFCVMGMLVNVPAMLSHPSILVFSVVYSVIAIVSKVVGCGLPTYLVGFNTKGALRVGLGMLPRGEVALIVAGVGLAANIIDLPMFGVAIAMTLITTLMAPPLLVKAFDGTSGMRKGEEKKETKEEEEPLMVLSLGESSLVVPFVKCLQEVLENKEFHFHLLGHDPLLYRGERGQEAIEVRQEGSKLIFQFPKELLEEVKESASKALEKFQEKVEKAHIQMREDQ